MWPGFGDNMRVLKWILDRCRGRAYAVEASIGWMPRPEDLDMDSLDLSAEDFVALQTVSLEELKTETGVGSGARWWRSGTARLPPTLAL